MPIYEYKCDHCGYAFEVFSGFSHNGTRKCPHCGARAKRIISAPGVIFKGPGFYATDHRVDREPEESGGSGIDVTPKKSGKKSKKSV